VTARRTHRMTAAQLSGVSCPYLLRLVGEDDSAWLLVEHRPAVAHRPERLPSDTADGPDRIAWLDGVTVDLPDGTVRFFDWTDEVEVRAP
jgi:hypothetical protein